MEILHGGVEALFAKVAKTLKKQSETEGAGSYQSLWKPLWFWFVSSCFGVEVLALQSVTAWCQNWSSGAQGRREAPAAFFVTKYAFPDKSDQPGAVPKPGFASIRVKEAANQGPTPNESIFEEHGSRGVRK